jgi:hypothetical protein
VAIQTNTTNICKVQLLRDVLLPSQLHSAHLLLKGFFSNVEVSFLPWSLIRFGRVLIIVSKTLTAEAGTDMGKKAGEGFNHRVAHRTKGLAAAELKELLTLRWETAAAGQAADQDNSDD